MHSGKKPVSCTPCAKRKVRCDKCQPCYHCKRRKGDACIYPVQQVGGPDSRPDDSSRRIEKLEVYIRRLGGDPQLIEQIAESGEANTRESSTRCAPTEAQRAVNMTSTSGLKIKTSSTKETEEPIGKQSGLVEHGEQVTYIEAYGLLRALESFGMLLTISFQTNVVQLERHKEA